MNKLMTRTADLFPLMLAGVMIVGLTNCSGDEASFETVESNKSIAKENALLSAKAWRSKHRPDGMVDTHGDSSVKTKCPQGDGWASVKVLDKETGMVLDELKCSTYSKADGCLVKADFQKRESLVSQEGGCATNAPPLITPFAQ